MQQIAAQPIANHQNIKNMNPVVLLLGVNERQKTCTNINALYSLPVSSMILNQIIQQAKQVIRIKQVVKHNINQFSYKYSKSVQEQVVKEQMNRFIYLQKIIQQQQPSPLIRDNLNPIFAQIQYKQKYQKQQNQSLRGQKSIKNEASKKRSVALSQQSNKPNKTESDKAKQSDYNSLQQIQNIQTQIKEDKLIQAMRTQLIQKSSYKNVSQAQNKRDPKDYIKKDEKVSYDYEGQLIKIKPNNLKPNFLQTAIKSQSNLPTIKFKQNKLQINQTVIDNPLKKDLIKKNFTKRGQDIQFSAISSLANQMKVLDGVKFVSEKVTIEQKSKDLQVNQLKNSILNRKLSKNQFQRLKSLGSQRSIKKNSQASILPPIMRSEPDLEVPNSSILSRSVSESKFHTFDYNKSLQKIKERILIQNQQLAQYLLQKMNNSIQQTFLKQKQPINYKSTNVLTDLSMTDKHKANLKYIRTGRVGIIDYISLKKTPSIYKKQKIGSIQSLKSVNKNELNNQKMKKLKKTIQNKLNI